jgi:hypothetical protein
VTFEEHLEWASHIVATWPEWKQNVLGGYHAKIKRTRASKERPTMDETSEVVQP